MESRLRRFLLRTDCTVEALDWEAATVLGTVEADAPVGGIAVIIDWEGITAVDLLGPAASLPDAAGEAGAVAWEVERIGAGIPAMGSEVDADTIPNASIIPPPPKSPTMLIGGVGLSPARPKCASAPASAM